MLRHLATAFALSSSLLACDSGDGSTTSDTLASSSDTVATTASPDDTSSSVDPEQPDETGHYCGMWLHDKGACTDCAIAQCCPESYACSRGQPCVDCVALALQGDQLGLSQAGCYDNTDYVALSDCINDGARCGPICNPALSCSAIPCAGNDVCTSSGCSACGGSGYCE